MHPERFGCELGRQRVLTVNSLRLHCLEWGQPGGAGLCFLHGGSAHAHWFDAAAPVFADRFHVVSLDQRGHGESQWPEPPAYRTQDFAEDLLGVMDALGWKRMVLVGHSMGGHNALCFAAWHPSRVERLVIVDSRPSIPVDRLWDMHRRGYRPLRRYESAEAAVARFRLLPRETTASSELLAHLARAGLIERDGKWTYRFDPACNGARRPVDAWPLLPRIECPTLIVRGEKSPILPSQMGMEMAKKIPRAVLHEIPGVYHHLMLDAPGVFATLLDRFLTG
ncbi:MAG: alpha/beta hydrolase [Candidatus Rokubacteria bacterium]|nr:alpha/beta hydrolase [Candidatus Rokubacteria bacterium]